MSAKCGCALMDDSLISEPSPCALNCDGCLYPALVEVHAQTEARMREGREVVKALILAGAWSGAPEAVAAEKWLEETK